MIQANKIIKEILKDARDVKRYYNDYRLFKPYQVKLYNWFRFSPDEWLPRFVYERGILKHTKKSLAFFSVFGRRLNLNMDRSHFKIFYTGENVHSRFLEYEDLLLKNKNISLSIGFDYLENEKYVRFPIWLMNLFEPTESYQSIKEKCNRWNNFDETMKREKFCSFLSRHDYFGDRLFFYNEVKSIGRIDCDGDFMHNNNDLREKYDDNKFDYLINYKFNLCPENSNYPGYCTEKVFETIKCGCIPIYWGSNNNPEPEVLNHNAIIFLNNKDKNNQPLNEIDLLSRDKDKYLAFAEQKRFTVHAPDVIFEYFTGLENKISALVKNC